MLSSAPQSPSSAPPAAPAGAVGAPDSPACELREVPHTLLPHPHALELLQVELWLLLL